MMNATSTRNINSNSIYLFIEGIGDNDYAKNKEGDNGDHRRSRVDVNDLKLSPLPVRFSIWVISKPLFPLNIHDYQGVYDAVCAYPLLAF